MTLELEETLELLSQLANKWHKETIRHWPLDDDDRILRCIDDVVNMMKMLRCGLPTSARETAEVMAEGYRSEIPTKVWDYLEKHGESPFKD